MRIASQVWPEFQPHGSEMYCTPTYDTRKSLRFPSHVAGAKTIEEEKRLHQQKGSEDSDDLDDGEEGELEPDSESKVSNAKSSRQTRGRTPRDRRKRRKLAAKGN